MEGLVVRHAAPLKRPIRWFRFLFFFPFANTCPLDQAERWPIPEEGQLCLRLLWVDVLWHLAWSASAQSFAAAWWHKSRWHLRGQAFDTPCFAIFFFVLANKADWTLASFRLSFNRWMGLRIGLVRDH